MRLPTALCSVVMTSNVKRAFSILELVAGYADGLHLQEIADRLGMPASAAHRHLAELSELGYVRPGGRQGAYTATTKLVRMAFTILAELGIVDLAQPILDRLARISGELVRLAVRDGDRLNFVARAQGARGGLIYDGDMGQEPVLFATATGMAWLATLSDEEALRLVARQGLGPPNPLAPRTPQTVKAVLARIAEARRAGYGLGIESAYPGTNAIAAAVHAKDGTVLGTISIAGPSVRLTAVRLAELAPDLVAAVSELGELRAGSPALASRTGWILADDPREPLRAGSAAAAPGKRPGRPRRRTTPEQAAE